MTRLRVRHSRAGRARRAARRGGWRLRRSSGRLLDDEAVAGREPSGLLERLVGRIDPHGLLVLDVGDSAQVEDLLHELVEARRSSRRCRKTSSLHGVLPQEPAIGRRWTASSRASTSARWSPGEVDPQQHLALGQPHELRAEVRLHVHLRHDLPLTDAASGSPPSPRRASTARFASSPPP